MANSSAASTSWASAIPVGSSGSVTGPWCRLGSRAGTTNSSAASTSWARSRCSLASGAGTTNSSAASTSWAVLAVQPRIRSGHHELLGGEHVVGGVVPACGVGHRS